MDGRDLVIVDKLAGEIHRPVGEAVRASIQHAIGLQETTVIDILPGGIFYHNLDPCLVEIANLGNERVANILVLDDDECLHHLVWLQAKWDGAKGSDHFVVAGLFQRENVHVEERAALKELNCFLQLLVEAVIERYRRVSRQPAMRRQLPLLRAVVGQSGCCAMHVAVLTWTEVRLVESQRIALGELGVLPLVIDGKSTDELVIVERTRQVGFMAGGTEFRRLIKRLHDGPRVTLRMLQDIAERNLAGHAIALLVHHYGRLTHHKAAIPRG